MTTILIINAISAPLAAAGLGGLILRARRRAERVRPALITVEGRRVKHPG